MKKRVGIYAASMGENAFGVGKPYLDLIIKLGCVPRILTPDNTFDENVDGLLLQGGLDLNPFSNDQIPGYYTSNTDVFKQHVYDKCLPQYVENNIPIFGVCLGMQQLAAFFGSRITQDLPYHPQGEQSTRWKKVHKAFPENLDIVKSFEKEIEVNSFHHQGILRKHLSEQLVPLFYAENEVLKTESEIHIIESFIHRDLPIAAVQWHPEDLGAWSIRTLFNHIMGI